MQIGIYEVIELLGDGGMGSVYRCRDPRFDRHVALKVLHPHFQRNPDVVLRFKTEAVVQAKLAHPHIVTVYDFLSDEKGLAIVMELVEGSSAERWVETEGPFALERGLHLFEQVLGAIGYAHDEKLIHRDIKPSNVLIQPTGGSEIAKVVDFGIAKIVGSDRQRTATSAKLGTLAYMSPEQVRSPRAADVRSDVYSLGATLQQLLTGSLPFDAESDYQMMRAILEAEPAPPLLDGHPLPERFDRAIRKALVRDPDQRFQSCAEFLDALRGGQINLPAPLEAPAPRPSEPPHPPPRPLERAGAQRPHVQADGPHHRHLIAPLGVMLMGLLLLGGGTVAWRLHRGSAEQVARAQEDARIAERRADQEALRLQEEAAARQREGRERQRQEELEKQRMERERAAADQRDRDRRQQEARRLASARGPVEAAIHAASEARRRGDLEGARNRLQAARAAVPEDLRADLDGQLATVQELLREIDHDWLEQEDARRSEEASRAAQRQVFEGQLSVARAYLADGRFPEAKTVTEKVLEQADLPSDLRHEAEELVAAARAALAGAWRPARVEEATQRKRKPPNP